MEKIILELEVDKKTAIAFRNAPPEKQERAKERARESMQRVLMTPEEIDQDAFDEATERLEQTVTEISKRAAARGATQEIVDALLDEE